MAAFKKSLLCHEEEKGVSLFVTYVRVSVGRCQSLSDPLKSPSKQKSIFFTIVSTHLNTLDLDSDAKEFNISVLFSSEGGGQIY